MNMNDVQAMAYNAMSLPQPKKHVVNPTAAIYRYWLLHKDVGTPLTGEMTLDDGTTALVTSTGRVLHWLGGDQVEVL